MEVYALPHNSPLRLCCHRRSIHSSLPSSLMFFQSKGLYYSRSCPNRLSVSCSSYNPVVNCAPCISRTHTGEAWCGGSQELFDPPYFFHNNQRKRDKLPRNMVVRSDIAGTGIPDAAAFPLSEVKFGSKVRGVCFYATSAIVAIFLFMVMVLQHPFVLLFDKYRRKAHHFIAKTWAALTVAPFFKIEVEGLENLPPIDTPAVYVSNHQSFLDIYTLLTLGRSFKFISKTSIFVFPIIGWAMSLMGVIPLKRTDSRSQFECLKRCMDLVNKGASVCFFPEGTRSKDGKLGTFKKGAFSVAAKAGVPVVPITLMGTGQIMPAGMEGILNRGSVKVVIHKPIKGTSADTLCSEATITIADALVRKV